MNGFAYRYRAARVDGAIEVGVLDAESRTSAAILLGTRGLLPIELSVDASERDVRAKISAGDLALGLRLLSTLLKSGMPMGRALAAFGDIAPERWQRVLPGLRDAIREGKGLASAMAAAPLAFPPVVIGIIRAGEAGSGLALGVRRSAELMESVAATQSAIRNALAYPLLLAIAGGCSVAMLVGVVLPRFAIMLGDLGQELPPTTRIALGLATLVRASAIPAGVATIAASVLWRAWINTPQGRARWHEGLLELPLIGGVRLASASSRVTAAAAALLESGVPLATTLAHAADASGDAALASRLRASREAVIGGQSLAVALAQHRAATSTTMRLVRAGEESGDLAGMLSHAATLDRERAEQLVRTAVRLIEPLLIIIFGGLVAFVAAALLQAVYSIRPAP